MSTFEWRVDPVTHIVMQDPPFSQGKVALNGRQLDVEWRNNRFDFSLDDGRPASITLRAETMSRENELVVDGKLIPDTRHVPGDLRCPACQSQIQLLDEYCPKCGNALGSPSRFMHLHSVQGATSAIRILAALYAVFGVIMFFVNYGDTNAALENLKQFADHEVLAPVDGVTYTAGELRKLVIWEHRGLLVVNLFLCALMLVLAWWSKRKPLPAILVAAAVFAAVQVLNAMIDPKTLVQGILIKIFIVAVLIKGIKGALDVRTAHG